MRRLVPVRPARAVAVPLIGLVLAGTLLAGCSTADDNPATSTAGSAAAKTADPSASPSQSPLDVESGTGGESAEAASQETTAAGNVGDVEASADAGQIDVSEPVALDEPAEVAGGVSVTLQEIRSGRSTAVAPGEISGPALIVTVSVANNTDKPISLNSSFVSLIDGDGILAIPSPSAPARPLSGRLAPAATAEGVYVFTTPSGARQNITVYVSPTAGVPVAQFVGDAE